MFHQAQVSLVNAFFDSDPLHLLDWILFHLRALSHDVCHLADGYHAYATFSCVDTTYASSELLDMGEFVSFHVDDAWHVVALEYLQDHQRLPFIQFAEQFVRQSKH